MITVDDLIRDALSLPRSDRGYLASKLIESLEEDGELSDSEKRLLDRRSRELRDGSSAALTFEQLKEKMAARRG